MYTVKFYLDTNSNTKKGHPIRIETYCDKTKKQRRRSSGHYQKRKNIKMSPELTRLLGELQERADYANKMNLGYDRAMEVIDNGYTDEKEIKILRERLAELEKMDSKPLIDFIKKVIEERDLEGRSTRHFEELIRELEKWHEEILYINDITYQKLKQYESFKRQNSVTKGAIIQKTVRTLRTVYNEAKRRGLVHNIVDPFEGLKIVVDSQARRKFITKQHLTSFKNFKPKKGTTKKNMENMMRSRDLFMFQIYIGGHDMADAANFKWSDFHEVDSVKRIRFQRFKLRSRNNKLWVDNIIIPEAQEIINKYGTPNDERVFGWLARPDSATYKLHNGYQLKTLDRICKTMGIPKLGTKTPRYIFRSIGGQQGVNDILLNQIMGHKPASMTHRYQQNLSLEAQDEAHRNIVKMLFLTEVPNYKLDEDVPKGFLLSWKESKEGNADINPNLIYL